MSATYSITLQGSRNWRLGGNSTTPRESSCKKVVFTFILDTGKDTHAHRDSGVTTSDVRVTQDHGDCVFMPLTLAAVVGV